MTKSSVVQNWMAARTSSSSRSFCNFNFQFSRFDSPATRPARRREISGRGLGESKVAPGKRSTEAAPRQWKMAGLSAVHFTFLGSPPNLNRNLNLNLCLLRPKRIEIMIRIKIRIRKAQPKKMKFQPGQRLAAARAMNSDWLRRGGPDGRLRRTYFPSAWRMPRLDIVGQAGFQDFVPHPVPQLAVLHWEDGFNAAEKIARHPVRAAQENLRLAAVLKIINPAVLQKAVHHAAHRDVVADPGPLRPQTADAAHQKINSTPACDAR